MFEQFYVILIGKIDRLCGNINLVEVGVGVGIIPTPTYWRVIMFLARGSV